MQQFKIINSAGTLVKWQRSIDKIEGQQYELQNIKGEMDFDELERKLEEYYGK
ncbi:MAG: hypothetical protein PUF65_06830 [Lachnospiraceae bacterium]|nr:hypothetical protein [Lachnospiraceae bacterium]